MNLQKIQSYIILFKRYLKSAEAERQLYKWESLQFFQDNWELLFANMTPDYVRHSFKDLLEEEKNIADRVDRFIFYCDEMLTEYKTQNGLSIENNHYQKQKYPRTK